MKKSKFSKVLSSILCTLLIAATALFASGCSTTASSTPESSVSSQASTAGENGNIVGEGATQFSLTVTDLDGNETSFEVHTDKTTVGEALLDAGFIAGDEGDYGLYVNTVNGITLDYDKDGKYWAFYIDGDYASTGVDSTEIKEGSVYALKAE